MVELERQVLMHYQNEIKEYCELYAESNRVRNIRRGKNEKQPVKVDKM